MLKMLQPSVVATNPSINFNIILSEFRQDEQVHHMENSTSPDININI